jgi:hypothetical protein
VKNSKKLRSVLEIILAFGNYLNSSKRGPAYGFKLQSLDTLLDTKSTDKRMCLLHYIVATIRQKFPELLSFDSDLHYIEKAAVGECFASLRNKRNPRSRCSATKHRNPKIFLHDESEVMSTVRFRPRVFLERSRHLTPIYDQNPFEG